MIYKTMTKKERERVVAQGERARPLPQPRLPSGQEVQEHELTHIPHRSWCVLCIAYEEQGDPMPIADGARQGEAEKEQHITTCNIDSVFMIDNGDLCTREEMERVGWEKTRGYSAGERGSGHWRNPSTLCLGKRKRRPVDCRERSKATSKTLDTAVRLFEASQDQKPAIVDVQRAVIAKRGNAATILVNSPAGDSQSYGRVENANKKVRHMVETIFSSLESRWGVRVTRDHPVCPWMFGRVC